MTRILADAQLLAQLHNITMPLEICDGSGKVLGRVFPVANMSAYTPWEPTIDEEELKQTEKSTEWYSTAEVVSHLEKL